MDDEATKAHLNSLIFAFNWFCSYHSVRVLLPFFFQAEGLTRKLKAAKQATGGAAVKTTLRDAKRMQYELKQAACDEARTRKQLQEDHAIVHAYS